MTGVILAAGDGTRLRNSSDIQTCKPLVKINDTHLIEFSLDNLLVMGVAHVIIVTGSNSSAIREIIGNEYKGLAISYVFQQQQKGLIHAFMKALAVVNDDDVVLQLADEILIDFMRDEINVMLQEKACDFYCGYTHENDYNKIKNNYSIDTNETGQIIKCIEKPSEIINDKKGTGFCIFKSGSVQILKAIYDDTINSPNDLCDFINYLTEHHKNGMAFCVAQKEFNINTVDDLYEAEQFFTSYNNT